MKQEKPNGVVNEMSGLLGGLSVLGELVVREDPGLLELLEHLLLLVVELVHPLLDPLRRGRQLKEVGFDHCTNFRFLTDFEKKSCIFGMFLNGSWSII